jgi:4-amino-4-deoxy-L-arabinose transferase-like glycosyltransferase
VKRWWPGIILLLTLWATRVWAVHVLPLHNDEGLHLTRAVEVWHGRPFWAISDGKIINHWLIAVFDPRAAPVLAGRFATIFIAMIGLAAGYALARQAAGRIGALLAGSLWIASPYLFFYERLAFSDAEAGALVVLALWLSLRAARFGGWRSTILAGLAFAAAALFKFTAAPFALSVALVILFAGGILTRRRWLQLGLIAGIVIVCFLPPLLYLMLKGQSLFSIALAWIGGGSAGGGFGLTGNLARLWAQLTQFGPISWSALMIAGVILLAQSRRRIAILLLLGGFIPLLLMIILGSEVLSRHYVVALPLMLTLGGVGLGSGINRLRQMQARQIATAGGIVALLMGFVPFAVTAYTIPALLPLPDEVRYEHITSHSSGYGLREAMESFPQRITRRDVSIIASMFPDSCRRANFYAVDGFALTCVDLPGTDEINAALKNGGAVYVLADNAPNIGIDVKTLNAKTTRIAAYPRPGESEANASVVLWLLENPSAQGVTLADCSPDVLKNAVVTLPTYRPSPLTGFTSIKDGHFTVDGSQLLVRGVNYYPARFPWRRFLTESDTPTINAELELLHKTGFNTLRIFLWNEALFVCSSSVPNPAAFQRLDTIIQSAAAQHFRLIVTLNDLPDLTKNVLYTNPQQTIAQTRLIIERYREEPAILAWDVRNEGDIDYGSNNALNARFKRDDVLKWLDNTTVLVRQLDKNHLITAGWLFDNEATAPYVDFVSLHHWDNDAKLSERIAALRLKTNKPLLVEEFGYSTYRVSPEQQSQLLGATIQVSEQQLAGWVIWTAFDFPLDATCIRPVCPSKDNAEHHFGLWYADSAPKPIVAWLLDKLK